MINLIAAIAKNGVIGNQNKLPWNLSTEFQLFQETTKDATIIMGRKTYDAIGRGMLNRKNIILSKTRKTLSGVEVCDNISLAIEKAKSYSKPIFIIGGAEIYRQTFHLAEKMYLSFIKNEYAGETFFPTFNKQQWEIESTKNYPDFEFIIYRRKK